VTVQRLLRLLALIPYQLANVLVCLAGLLWFRLGGSRRIRNSGLGGRSGRVAMLSFVAVRYDPRIRRAATALASAGYDVAVIKPANADQGDEAIQWHDRIRFVSVGQAGSSSYFPWCFDLHMYRAAVATGAGIVHCHDANTCLMGALAAARLRAALVVDFHEWYSEHGATNVSGNFGFAAHAGMKRWVFRGIERLAAGCATVLITVGQEYVRDGQEVIPVDEETLEPMAKGTTS